MQAIVTGNEMVAGLGKLTSGLCDRISTLEKADAVRAFVEVCNVGQALEGAARMTVKAFALWYVKASGLDVLKVSDAEAGTLFEKLTADAIETGTVIPNTARSKKSRMLSAIAEAKADHARALAIVEGARQHATLGPAAATLPTDGLLTSAGTLSALRSVDLLAANALEKATAPATKTRKASGQTAQTGHKAAQDTAPAAQDTAPAAPADKLAVGDGRVYGAALWAAWAALAGDAGKLAAARARAKAYIAKHGPDAVEAAALVVIAEKFISADA